MESTKTLNLDKLRQSRINVFKNSDALKWIRDKADAYQPGKLPLLSDISGKLRELFGEQAETIKGNLHIVDVWYLKHNTTNVIVSIISEGLAPAYRISDGLAPAYHIIVNDDETIDQKSQEIIDFLTELDRLLTK
jgi:hypothetical protein